MCNHETKLYGRCLACGEQVDPAPVEDFTPAAPALDEATPALDLDPLFGNGVAIQEVRDLADEARDKAIDASARVSKVETLIGDLQSQLEEIRATVARLMAQPPATSESPAVVEPVP